MIFPRRLCPAHKIGIVSPSSPVNAADLEKGINCFQERGYSVELAPHALNQSGDAGLAYLAGDDSDRAKDINSFFSRDEIDAIICARGGYGAIRLVDRLDWNAIRAHPKIFVGYSDITSIHLGIARQRGFVTFHGPMAAAHAKLGDSAKAQFWHMLESPNAYGELPADTAAISTLVSGSAVGELAGGCLCLMAHSCGSKYGPDFSGKIVLIEDVGEAVYRADRNLWQLRNSGAFDHAAGFVIGSLTNWKSMEADPPLNTPSMLFEEFFGSLGKPTISGFPFGHEPNPLTLPLGVKAHLDADSKTLTLLEGAVS
jgi:muramoyltetrapeptide carboxypeptidase